MPAAKKPAGSGVRNQTAPTKITPLPTVLVHIPEPPHDLLDVTLGEWETFWRSEIGSAAVESDHPTIARLFVYRNMWRQARAIYEEEPVVAGSKGQKRMHPAATQMIALESAMATLEGKLGMTPYDRQRLGLAIGKATLTAAEVNQLANRSAKPTENEAEDLEAVEAEWF